MKRIKILLMGMAVFALISVILAFKVKNNQDYCTSVPGGNCETKICLSRLVGSQPGGTKNTWCAVEIGNARDCNEIAPNCEFEDQFTVN